MHAVLPLSLLILFAATPITHERALSRRCETARTEGEVILSNDNRVIVNPSLSARDRNGLLRYSWSDTRFTPQVRDMTSADVNDDGKNELIVVWADTGRSAGGLLVLTEEGDELRESTSFVRRDYLPIRVEAGDVDADGKIEVAVLLFDRAKRASERFAMKFHLFDLRDGRLAPRWFSEREVEDFRFVDWEGHGRLLVLERAYSSHAVRLFRWDRFGFWLEKNMLVSTSPIHLERDARRVVVREAVGNRSVICEEGRVITARYP